MQQGKPLGQEGDESPVSAPTRAYDVGFLGDDEWIEIEPTIEPPDALDHLEVASTNLALFSHAAELALCSMGLTGDQRLHVSKILVFVQDLGRRLDVVRVPGFEVDT